MKNLISSEILNLSGIEITNVEIRNNEVHIYIKSSDDNLECPLCHSNDVYVHHTAVAFSKTSHIKIKAMSA